MSMSLTKADGVTVITLTSDPQSACPPLCQFLKGLCYSPACCSVSQHLRRVQKTSQSVLGALQIMVGLLNIGLGAILCSSHAGSSWQMDESLFPFWFGGLFMLFGAISIASEKCPSPCLVVLSVILNLVGVAFAIAAIVLYIINTSEVYLWNICNDDDYGYQPSTQSPHMQVIIDRCLEGKAMILVLLRSISAVLVVLSALELCVVVSSAVLGIKALRSSEKRETKITFDPQQYRPLLEEVTSNPTV